MSQYGAYGRAEAGRSATNILEHYYSGARVTGVNMPSRVRVGLLEAYDCDNVGNQSPPGTAAPPCVVAPNLEFQGRRTRYPQLRRAP